MKKVLFALSLMVMAGLSALAQTTNVTGTVTDAGDGFPIPGVSVFVKGTTIGTVTMPDGTYTLAVPDDATAVVFSFVGMTTQEVAFTGQTTIDVALESDAIDMDEVVVTALGISKDKKAIGYASTSVAGDEIAGSQSVNPMNALQGKVAGIDISSAPGPGATQNVMIRGSSSFGSNQPLYVVDGVPIVNAQNRSGSSLNAQVDFGSGINALNPDDIEEMTILKGAAATALYGSRAANGVILVTTKSGKNTNGKLQINYDGSIAISRVGRIPERQSMFGQGWSGNRALDENGNWGAPYDGKERVWGNVVDNSQQLKPYEYLEDRVRDFYDYGVNYKNAISASGGNEKTNYFFSLSNNSVDGVLPESVDTYDRTTLATRGSHKAGAIKVSTSLNYSNEKTKAVPSGQGTTVFRSLWEIPEDVSIVDFEDYKNNKFNTLDNYFTPYGINPYYSLNENKAEQSKNKFFGKVQLDLELSDHLDATYRFGGDIETSTAESMQAQISFSNGAPNEGSSTESPGSYEIHKRTRYETNHDAYITYNNGFGDLNINAMVGTNINEQGYDRVGGVVNALDVPGFYNLQNGLSDPIAEQYKRKRRLVGLFTNIDFDYKNFAYLTLTARNDWSSTLPKENNSYFYPGITGSFLFSEFANNQGGSLGPISFGKIRVAYGWTGNDANPYVVYPVFEKGESPNPGYPGVDDLVFPLGGVNSWMVSNTLGSLDLAPELTKEFEAGLEMNFFNNRFGFDFSFYDKLTEGLITALPMDPSTGYTSQTTNLGDVKNTGVELMLHGTPVKKGNFSWDISVNYAQNKNEVVKSSGGEIFLAGFGGTSIVAIEGEEMGLFKTTVPKTVEIDGVEHLVVDGNGMVQAKSDLEVLKDKSVNEKFRAGLTNTFTYKGLSVGATLDLRYGGYMFSYQKDYMHWTGSAIESTLNDRHTFIIPNSVVENADGTYSENTTPVSSSELHTFYSNGGFDRDDYAIIDKSYLKLRQVNVSYNLPRSWYSKLKVTNARISFVAANILLWTPAENQYIDPETTSFGNDISAKFGEFGANPTNQTYTFSLSLSF